LARRPRATFKLAQLRLEQGAVTAAVLHDDEHRAEDHGREAQRAARQQVGDLALREVDSAAPFPAEGDGEDAEGDAGQAI